MKCKICSAKRTVQQLARHVNNTHRISSFQYCVKYLGHDEAPPLCRCGCGQKVKRWEGMARGWQKFILGHNNNVRTNKTNEKISKSLKAKYQDGSLKVWNKGLDRKTDLRIDQYASNQEGRKLAESIKKKISKTVSSHHQSGNIYGNEWRRKIAQQASKKTPWKYLGHHNSRSRFEQAAFDLLARYGFEQEFEINTPRGIKGTYSLDFAHTAMKINVELDNVHLHKQQQDKDKIRDLHLTALGWKVIRVTFDKKETPQSVAQRVVDQVTPLIGGKNEDQVNKKKNKSAHRSL